MSHLDPPSIDPSDMLTEACIGCGMFVRFPTDQGAIVVTCPHCRTKWDWSPGPDEESRLSDDTAIEKREVDEMIPYIPHADEQSGDQDMTKGESNTEPPFARVIGKLPGGMAKSEPNANASERAAMEQFNLAFLDLKPFENGQCIRGAILVTNSKTDPLEFRCTSPIRPTALQKTLWGSRLTGYIASQIIGKPLLDAVSNKSSLVVVRDASLLELRPLINLPVVQLTSQEKTGKALRGARSEDDGNILDLDGSDGVTEAFVMKVHSGHGDDLAFARALLLKTSRSTSLLEPFQRIDTALGLVQQQG